MRTMSTETFPKNQIALPRRIEATVVVGAFLAVLVVLAMASSESVQPAQAAAKTPPSPAVGATQGHPARGGTLRGYQILL
jgi:hypothetical protein